MRKYQGSDDGAVGEDILQHLSGVRFLGAVLGYLKPALSASVSEEGTPLRRPYMQNYRCRPRTFGDASDVFVVAAVTTK